LLAVIEKIIDNLYILRMINSSGFRMQAEIAGLFGIIVILLFLFAETGGKVILGVFASLLMLLLGVWIIADPLTFKIAEHTVGTEIIQTNQTIIGGNTTTSSISTLNVTVNSTFVSPSNPTYIPLSYSGTVGLALALLSMFGMLHYGLRVGKEINGR